MKLNFEQIQTSEDFARDAGEKLGSYREVLAGVAEDGNYLTTESSVNLPSDERSILEIKEFAREKKAGLSLVLVVGIGGSSLGAKAIYEALRIEERGESRMLFVETVDARAISYIDDQLGELTHPEQVMVCVISKSGRTLETAANADFVYSFLKKRFGEEARGQVVIISDKDSDLEKLSQNEGFPFFEIPQKVGGRFSVFSAVGLLPLALVGVDIDLLTEGARNMRDEVIFSKGSQALYSSIALAYHYEQGRRIHDTFVFDPSLASLGDWYRQLLGESIGKTKVGTEAGARVGITPTTSVGSTDLHSVGQLYFGGPQDVRFTTFLGRESVLKDPKIPEERIFSRTIPELENKTSEEVLSALAHGAKEAYTEAGLPFVDVLLGEVKEFELGEFMQWKMLEIMFLAELLGVDAFDQPAVESYKKATRRILEG